MRADNFVLLQSAEPLRDFFDQFDPDWPESWSVRRGPPVEAEAVRRSAQRLGFWDGSPLMGSRPPYDARAYAREFRVRMAAEREALGIRSRPRMPADRFTRTIDRIIPFREPPEGE